MTAEVLVAICSDYTEFIDRIYDLKPDDVQDLTEDLINFCPQRKWDIAAVLLIIANAAECNLLLLREYWKLFKKLYNHFKIKPPVHKLKPHIAVLFSKEYQVRLNDVEIPDHLKDYQEIEEILNVHKPCTLLHCIFHDDINEFAIEMGLFNDKTLKQKIEDKTLLEWCSYYGALRCFKFLRMNDAEITQNCLAYSFIGKNKDIMMECLVDFGEILKQINIMDICIQINDQDYLITLHDDYKQLWTLESAADALNLKAFLMLASITNKKELAFLFWCFFGITEIVDATCYDLNQSEDYDANLALLVSAANNNIESITKLIEHGADIETKTDDGSTPLIIAAAKNNVESISKLIEFGANTEAKDNNGFTALIIAAANNNVESISKLIELHANTEAKDSNGLTALIVAAANNHVESISKLIELGANKNAKTDDGITALLLATANNHTESISKLIELGASIDA